MTAQEKDSKKSTHARAYYLRHRERIIAKTKEYRAKNRDRVEQYRKEYYAKHKAEIASKRKEYATANREKIRAVGRLRYAKSAEAIRQSAADRRVRDPSPSLFKSARSRAAKQALPFTLTLDNVRALYAEGQCECCGAFVQAEKRSSPSGPGAAAATLDRVVPSLGYVPGNVALLCWTCNRRKNDSTLGQLEQITAWLRMRLQR